MKKILLIGCGSEIGSNLLMLSKKYNLGFDIDTEWQFVVIEHWLKKRGFTETEIPWK